MKVAVPESIDGLVEEKRTFMNPQQVNLEKMDKKKYGGERFITFSEASQVLGIRSYSRISNLVEADCCGLTNCLKRIVFALGRARSLP